MRATAFDGAARVAHHDTQNAFNLTRREAQILV
jgi:hypothetical protein